MLQVTTDTRLTDSCWVPTEAAGTANQCHDKCSTQACHEECDRLHSKVSGDNKPAPPNLPAAKTPPSKPETMAIKPETTASGGSSTWAALSCILSACAAGVFLLAV